MIKLKPEHVGTRVLLSDSNVYFIIGVTDTHYLLTEAGKPLSLIKTDSLDDDITLLLDAPNPLDVEVPKWCAFVTIWGHQQILDVLAVEELWEWTLHPEKSGITGWSPAHGQMPPKNNKEFN